jgi:hypothetical protein
MVKKLAKVTSADVERVLADSAKARDEMADLIVMIHAGLCEPLDKPLHFAQRCMSVSVLYATATSHFLCRNELQERDASRGVTPKPT